MSNENQSPGEFCGGKLSVAVIMTGGTIAKSYNPTNARLYNFELKIKDLIAELRTDDLKFSYIDLFHLDSLEIGPQERARIVSKAAELSEIHDAVMVTHGTDSMVETAEALFASVGTPAVPVIFTGAMVPYAVAKSDAVQNITEALLAARLLPAGVYVSFHNRILSLPDVRKDYDSLTFAKG